MLISDSDVQTVRDVVGPDASDALIRAALKKYKNDKNNAIVALLDGSIKEEDDNEWIHNWNHDARGALNAQYNPSIDSMLNPHHNSPSTSQHDLSQYRGDNAGSLGLSDTGMHTEDEWKRNTYPEETGRSARWDRNKPYVDQPVSGPLQRGEERWALVPANSTQDVTTSQAQADADLNRALEMSLKQQYTMEVDSFREIEHTENVRTGSRPVALRARELNHVFAAILLQALYHVPQVRSVLRLYQADPSNHWLKDILRPVWKAFGCMDFLQAASSPIDYLFEDDQNRESNVYPGLDKYAAGGVGEQTEAFYTALAMEEPRLQAYRGEGAPRLFFSRICKPKLPPRRPQYSASAMPLLVEEGEDEVLGASNVQPAAIPPETRAEDFSAIEAHKGDTCSISITNNWHANAAASSSSNGNTLVGCLNGLSWERKLSVCAEVLVFTVKPPHVPVEQGKMGPLEKDSGEKQSNERTPLKYPARLFVDPFLEENAEIAGTQRRIRGEIYHQVLDMEKRVRILTSFERKDNLKNLRVSIAYYERLAKMDDSPSPAAANVVGSSGGSIPTRREVNEKMLSILKKALRDVEERLASLQSEIERAREMAEMCFDIDALKKNPYDLRAVLMSDGIPGRDHTYVYLHGYDGKWYKSLDAAVTEVSEEAVLNDSTGLHMGSGPYMLIYSKAVDAELESENMEEVAAMYDRGVKDEIGAWNRQFRMQLPEEQANAMEQADPLNDFGNENVVEGDGDEDAVVVQEEEVERLGHLSRDESMASMVD